jgi:nucleotide-binding universal stress UspA family protein
MKILVPIDGSQYSANSIEFLRSRSKLFGANPVIELLSVQAPVPSRASNLVQSDALKTYYDEEAGLVLNPALEALKDIGFPVQSRYSVGEAAPTIAQVANDIEADLIVMGSHGRSALKGLLLGSVTNAVLALSKKPLLILRNQPIPAKETLTVGIAVDGSKYGAAAVDYIIRHKARFGDKVEFQLINVVNDYAGMLMPDMAGMAVPTMDEQEIRAMQQETFDETVAPYRNALKDAGVPFKEICLVGNPGDEIAAYARNAKLDTIVMGSRGFGAFKAAVLGSTATRIAAISNVPLLVIQTEE